MKHDLESLKAALATTPAASWEGRLTRYVPFVALTAYDPPDWLYTSGNSNRFNPKGVHCVYFSVGPDVARMEYDEYWRGEEGAGQPATGFNADVRLRRMLDLTSAETLKLLGIQKEGLSANWHRARRPTLTQVIGQAVVETKLFSAIRYQSIAAARRRKSGVNIVIFPSCLKRGEFVRIVGPTKAPLQQLP